MNQRTDRIIADLPADWIRNYVRNFEAGRVQKHPQARFINVHGECCIVAAMSNARSAVEFSKTPVWAAFAGSGLETLSRAFEARRLTSQQFYEEALLALALRSAPEPVTV
jgi:hypothetical protein